MGEALGIASWTAAGAVVALLLRWLPPWRRSGLLATLAAALLGALVGGLLATDLGFGGLAGFDPRSLATAALAAVLALLLLALWRTRRPAGAGIAPAATGTQAAATAQRTRRS